MKTVQLNEAGYTADGKWRLVLVEPTPAQVSDEWRIGDAGLCCHFPALRGPT